MNKGSMGDYDLLDELGRGAMGVVYRAQDLKIGRTVAIKVIRVEAGTSAEDSAQLRQRLVREASAAGRIYHPGIVTVHQLGEQGENVFIVMEYVDGNSLEHLLSNNPMLDRSWTVDILHQIADALDYAHKSGVVHRDVKPANILIRHDGRAKIADFGIAKIASAATGLTGTGMSLGSPAYMSPEQIQATQIDGQSDQFALAIIAFQMLTGRMPFKGDTAHTVMYQIVTADPFESLPGDVPISAGARAVLAKALSKHPRDRFPDCATFIQSLTAALGTAPPAMQTSTAKMEAPQSGAVAAAPPKKGPLVPILLGFFLVAILGAGLFWYLHRTCCAPPPATVPPAQKALIKAIIDGPPDSIDKLITPSTVNDANADGMTPLLAAITYGKLGTVKSLLAKGGNVNAPDRYGVTPLILASEGTAYLPNNMPLVETILGANANMEAQDSRGRTALHAAVYAGKLDVVKYLLDHNAAIDRKTNDGTTPLVTAIQYGKMPILEMLLERKAQVELSDASGNMPLMLAAEGSAYLPNNEPMVAALLAAGAHVDVVDSRGRSALYRASAEGKVDAMRLLLERQANPNLRANDRSTPLIEAVTYAKMNAAELLIEHGADVNMGDSNEATPLMIAADASPYIRNPADYINLLLDHGAHKAATDSRGRTALARATESKNAAAIELLK